MMDDWEGGIRRVFSRLVMRAHGPVPSYAAPAAEESRAAKAPQPAPGE
jgi:hypothetical protein